MLEEKYKAARKWFFFQDHDRLTMSHIFGSQIETPDFEGLYYKHFKIPNM